MVEEIINLNPQAEGSNTASGSSSFRKEVPDIRKLLVSDSDSEKESQNEKGDNKDKGKEKSSETEGNFSSSSSQFRTMIEEVMEDKKFEYDSDISSEYLSDSSEEAWNEKQHEYFQLGNKIIGLDKEIEIAEKKFEKGLEKWEKIPSGEKEERERGKELEKEQKELNKKIDERNKIWERYFELKKEIQRDKELSASTGKGKEVIKAEISKELIEAKEIFTNFQISETSKEEISRKIKKRLWNLNDRGIIAFSQMGIFYETNWKRSETEKELEETVIKLVNETTTDLEKQKKKVLKKMDALIEKREKEVAEAKKVIEALEVVNRERKNEIKGLQEGIRELNKQLKEYREKEKDAQNFLKKQREAERKRAMEADNNINQPIQDNQSKIKQLQDYINTLELSLKLAEDSRDQRELELEHTKNEIARKNNELERKMKIADDLQKKLNAEIREWEGKYQKIKENRDEIEEEKDDLLTKNKELKAKREKAEEEARKWKDEYEREKALHEPTWIQKGMKFLGVEKLQNAIATSASIAGCFVILWGISWMWKNVIKETWKNFKGEPEEEPQPRRKEKVRYTDYEEISEVKEKPQSLPEKQPTIIINNSTPTEKEPNSPAVVSKKPIKPEEILTQISDEKKTSSIAEKTESENQAKNGSKKKKKNKIKRK
jgi:hypothetical protein